MKSHIFGKHECKFLLKFLKGVQGFEGFGINLFCRVAENVLTHSHMLQYEKEKNI